MSDKLEVAKREETGTLRMRRLRKSGKIPAVLYGHGEETVMLSVKQNELNKVIDHGTQIVELAGLLKESALIKHVQWDAFGSHVLHLDLARIDANEEVDVKVALELVGDSPGSHNGGIVTLVKHEIHIACAANKLPDKIEVRINDLELEGVIHASDLELPPTAKLLDPPEETIVTCLLPHVEEEPETDGEPGAAEPEVIGAKDDDGEEAE